MLRMLDRSHIRGAFWLSTNTALRNTSNVDTTSWPKFRSMRRRSVCLMRCGSTYLLSFPGQRRSVEAKVMLPSWICAEGKKECFAPVSSRRNDVQMMMISAVEFLGVMRPHPLRCLVECEEEQRSPYQPETRQHVVSNS